MLKTLFFLLFIHEVKCSVKYSTLVVWPEGKFSLPRAKVPHGCPQASYFEFKVGHRIWDCEDKNPVSDASSAASRNMDVQIDTERDVHMGFCTHDEDINENQTTGSWPPGKYCFYRVGKSCPKGFETGWIKWQDESSRNMNKAEGPLPDGVYDEEGSTLMWFCCRTDGDPRDMISLPRRDPFFLLRYGDTCQVVEGTRSQALFVTWDSDDKSVGSTSGGVVPSKGIVDGNVKLFFCYYTATTYCGNPGVPEFGTVEGRGYAAGNTLTFSCEDGYRISGKDEITCLTNEEWSEVVPECKVIDNCKVDNGKCEHFCEFTGPGEHVCTCEKGYVIRGETQCVDINECEDLNFDTGCDKCINTVGGYECECHEGFQLMSDGATCKDIDECSLGKCDHVCENTEGSYHCSCKPGYVLEKDRESCEDIDECALQLHDCQQYCKNFDGGFECGCIEGFELEKDNKTCMNKNPCIKTALNPCEHPEHCKISPDSIDGFTCGCRFGYELSPDGVSCRDINECDMKIDGCKHVCVNLVGGYECKCWPGYKPVGDGKVCEDINECECEAGENCGGCQHRCINEKGHFRCECNKDYVPLTRDASRCVIPYSRDDPCRNSKCINMENTECRRISANETECVCKEGFYLNYNQTDCTVGYCETNPCPPNYTCEEGPNDRKCYPKFDKGTQEEVKDDNTGLNTRTRNAIFITAGVGVMWLIIVFVICLVIKKKRKKKQRKRYRESNNRHQFIPNAPIRNAHNLSANPLYMYNSLPLSGSQDHEYEDPDKLNSRRMKLASNSYEQGVDMPEDTEPYSYAVTPGPPTTAPPPLPLHTGAPDFV